MNRDLNFDLRYSLRAEDTTKERGNAFSNVVFLYLGALHYIGFLIQFFPYLILSRLIQNKGQQTDCLKKCLCNDLAIITGLADRETKQMLKTVMI